MSHNATEPIRLIRLTLTDDWGCEHTATDTAAYVAAVLAAVGDRFPSARVEAEMGLVQRILSTVRVTGLDSDDAAAYDAEREADECIAGIIRAVWDDGDFWATT